MYHLSPQRPLELDPGFLVIRLFEKLGLASNVRVPSEKVLEGRS